MAIASAIKATPSQLAVAYQHGIPQSQAHTINDKKYRHYLQWLSSPIARLERFLDQLEAQRATMISEGRMDAVE